MATPYTGILFRKAYHMWQMKSGPVFNIIPNHCNPSKSNFKKLFQPSSLVKFNKSNQLTSSVTLQVRHTHPLTRSPLPASVSFLFAVTWFRPS